MPKSRVMGRIQQSQIQARLRPLPLEEYTAFDLLDGSHSWQTRVPDGYVLYPVRKLNQGNIIYFNFDLAKEMGLIAKNHPHVMNKRLEKKLIETFSLRIINEYDQAQNVKFHPSIIKKNRYMATRYLQLQHKNKLGKTSGDGRSVWNGELETAEGHWDVSSRGTGVTQLSPGAVEAQKPLRSGSTDFGYGCGLADVDELVGAAIMAEIFHNNHINTERVLTVIDLGQGHGIGVRAGRNLFRPAHLFMYLKQGDFETLKKATDYFIERQHKNGEWTFGVSNKKKYDLMLRELTESFAQFSAQLDRDYIFTWLDWDGDNVLLNAGIIDYGSIRQFGLRHDEYRYDDVDRFSTNLSEQRLKTRQLIQVFAQMADFLKTGKKKPFQKYANHWAVRNFDSHFEYYLLDQFLCQVGLPRQKRENLLIERQKLVQKFYSSYKALETVKTKRKAQKVADGVNKPAIFNMRSILYFLPQEILKQFHGKKSGFSRGRQVGLLPTHLFFSLILAESARGRDRRLSKSTAKKIREFQNDYKEIMIRSFGEQELELQLKKICDNAFEANRPDRLTGDGLLNIVEEILKFKKKNTHDNKSIQQTIDQLVSAQSPSPENKPKNESRLHSGRRAQFLYQTLLTLIDGFKESI